MYWLYFWLWLHIMGLICVICLFVSVFSIYFEFTFLYVIFDLRYLGYPPVEINLLPFVAEWENQKKGRFFVHGSDFGNTPVESMDYGFFPGTPSRITEKRMVWSMKENTKNSFMFRMVKDLPEGEHYDDEFRKEKTFELVLFIWYYKYVMKLLAWSYFNNWLNL